MNTDNNNAVFNNTAEKNEWPFVAYIEDYTEAIQEIFFDEKGGKVFLDDNTRFGRYISEVQILFDEKIKPEIEKEEDCWSALVQIDTEERATKALEAGAIDEVHHWGTNSKIA